MEKILIQSEFIYYGNGLQLMPVFLELPIPVVKRTNLSSLQPTGDAVEVEGMIAHPPGNCALLTGSACLVCLALNAQVHDVVSEEAGVVFALQKRNITCRLHSYPPQYPRPTRQQHSISSPQTFSYPSLLGCWRLRETHCHCPHPL